MFWVAMILLKFENFISFERFALKKGFSCIVFKWIFDGWFPRATI